MFYENFVKATAAIEDVKLSDKRALRYLNCRKERFIEELRSNSR